MLTLIFPSAPVVQGWTTACDWLEAPLLGHSPCHRFIESCPQGVLRTIRVVIQPESSGCGSDSSCNVGEPSCDCQKAGSQSVLKWSCANCERGLKRCVDIKVWCSFRAQENYQWLGCIMTTYTPTEGAMFWWESIKAQRQKVIIGVIINPKTLCLPPGSLTS